MHRGRMLAALAAVLVLGGCGSGNTTEPVGPQSSSTTGSTNETSADGADLPDADPAFAEHFTDPVYDDPAGEFAPFGTDEGFDLVWEWSDRRDELGPTTTVADLVDGSGLADVASQLDVPERAGIPAAGGQVDAATITIGAGFSLLRLTGHIDDDGRRRTLQALDVLIDRYDAPVELVHQRADLESWPT
ncbi:hypothetical protein [Arthrobacter sp. NEB 688]|uniref:hypothetical protein n=1 Tax=Arthrobacter sp. NEB 688 TaxID=904039 RepID=UPI0015641496|nr:hypothetical protein [Arthrobacter sp. NEB 688]QKE84616.1 hypothetical protein HL663_12150 [Arthrobacter sp. NEB 688]